MYLVRRIAKTQPGKSWEVAGYLTKICNAYEENGRSKAQVYISGQGLPGTANVVYADWAQERIEPNVRSTVPAAVFSENAKMQPLLTEYSIEFYEVVTPEKIEDRGL